MTKIGRPLKDMTGERVGSITILYRGKDRIRKNGGHSIMWVGKCDCGDIKEYWASDLIKHKKRINKIGGVYSCGCQKRKGKGESSMLEVFANYKRKAKQRGYEFSIDLDYFKKITQENCHYCNTSPSNNFDRGYSTGGFSYNGIDRVNNKIGYLKSNTVPCCKICNIAKRDMSRDEFLTWIEKVHTNSVEKI
jgi:hypothetical protein